VGNVPLRWYKDEEHIGYDREGAKILRRQGQDRLDALLARNDAGGRALRTLYDEYNDEEIVLSKEEVQLIQRIRAGRFPHVEVRCWGVLSFVACMPRGSMQQTESAHDKKAPPHAESPLRAASRA
jgi:hypothetical protein